ncbi:unnamed protein product [Cuscuta campestris]|uniref:Uncharacterized protein n=1 Tax=Cuscuta campestris TaxID=132261 RepID=A0A484LZ34_9ASTE|nr:unnamed protein product [Cuscuta campestris]
MELSPAGTLLRPKARSVRWILEIETVGENENPGRDFVVRPNTDPTPWPKPLNTRADIGLGRSCPAQSSTRPFCSAQSSTRPAARLCAPLVPSARLRAPLVLLPGSALRSSLLLGSELHSSCTALRSARPSCSAQSSTRPAARLCAPLVLPARLGQPSRARTPRQRRAESDVQQRLGESDRMKGTRPKDR